MKLYFRNKLEKPLFEGAVPNAGEIEIVEDYEEEAHNNWLKQHKDSMKKQKQEERIQREFHTNEEDVFRKLEERELMEELGLDPDNLNEDALSNLLSNQVETPQWPSEICDKEAMSDKGIFDILDKLEAQEKHEESEIDPEVELNLQSTNDFVRNLMKGQTEENPSKWRPQVGRAINEVEKPTEDLDIMDEDDVEDEIDPDQPDEVKLIREQLSQLPMEQQEMFLKSQVQILKSKMRKMQTEHFISDELTHLLNVVVCLEDDLQDMMFDKIQAASTDELSDESESFPDIPDSNTKRRISFAATDEELIFRKEEAVAQMLPKKKPQERREVISLDAPLKHAPKEVGIKEPLKPIGSKVMQKVEQNLEFVMEHQSVQDFDLLNQILEASTGQINTLHIRVKHSNTVAASTECDKGIPGSPADIYNLHKRL